MQPTNKKKNYKEIKQTEQANPKEMSQEITPKLHQRFANIGSQICNSSNICPAQLRKQCLNHNPVDACSNKNINTNAPKRYLKKQSTIEPRSIKKQC